MTARRKAQLKLKTDNGTSKSDSRLRQFFARARRRTDTLPTPTRSATGTEPIPPAQILHARSEGDLLPDGKPDFLGEDSLRDTILALSADDTSRDTLAHEPVDEQRDTLTLEQEHESIMELRLTEVQEKESFSIPADAEKVADRAKNESERLFRQRTRMDRLARRCVY
jgi:hypothetical protein